MKRANILGEIEVTTESFAPPFFNHFSLSLYRKETYGNESHEKETTEAVVRRYSSKWVFVKLSQIPQENTRCFPVKFTEFNEHLFHETPSVANFETKHTHYLVADLLHIRVGNLDWWKWGNCKNEAREIDCIWCRDVDVMLIALAKILEREGNISPCSFYKQRLLVTRVSFTYLVDEFFFLFLVKLNKMRTLGESKTLSFFFLMSIKWDEEGRWVQDFLLLPHGFEIFSEILLSEFLLLLIQECLISIRWILTEF